MPRLIWSPSARDDLREIDIFLADRGSAAAGRVLRAIRATATRLLEYPRIGRALETPFRVFGVRGTPYVIVYRLLDDAIEVIRIRHMRENWTIAPEGEP